MYGRAASLLAGNWSPVGPSGHYGSYTGVDHLFYELVAVTIFEKKLQLGMLNPYVEPFVPGENNEEINQEKWTPQNQAGPTISTAEQNNNKNKSKHNQRQTGQFTEKWIESGRIFQRMKIPQTKCEEEENYYSVLDKDGFIGNDNRIVF